MSKHIVLEPEGFHFTPFEYHDFHMHIFSHLRDFSTIGHFARNIQMNYNPGESREDRKEKYLHNNEMIKNTKGKNWKRIHYEKELRET